MLVQELLDFTRIDVFSTANDHVLDTPDNPAVAIVVEGREIAGVHPSFGVDGFLRAGLVSPIPQHHRIAARAKLAGLAARHDLALAIDDLDLEVRLNAADRGYAQIDRIVATALETHRTGLRHPVCDGDFGHVHPRHHLLHHLDR